MKTITIEGHLRTETGKKAARHIRAQEMVPGVIYGGPAEISFYAAEKAFRPLVYTPDFQFAEVQLNGKTYKCILKDLQFHKVSDALIHVDLFELVADKKVIATIPVKYTGVAKGVKDGGKLVVKMKALKIKTLPKHLKENIEVDLSDLALNENIRVEDVKEANFEILNSPRIPMASVVLTRQLKQEEASTATPAAAKAVPAKAAAPAKATAK
jgi:large subunit ribosomal protein L25